MSIKSALHVHFRNDACDVSQLDQIMPISQLDKIMHVSELDKIMFICVLSGLTNSKNYFGVFNPLKLSNIKGCIFLS